MRPFIPGSLLMIVTGVLGGCASGMGGMGAKTEAPAARPADKVADVITCVMPSGGSDVLRLTMPADSKSTAKDGSLHIKAPTFEVEVWLAPGAQTVDDAVGNVPRQIESEFKDFKPDQTSDLTIAGAPAKRLAGHGHEADDGDNGDADVIVFKVGDHVFVACTHDERLVDSDRLGLLTLVQTAQVP